MDARAVVVILLAVCVCLVILAPMAFRLSLGAEGAALSDTVVNSITDLAKMALGGVLVWLGARKDPA